MAQAKRPDIDKIVMHYINNLQALGIAVEKAYVFGSQSKGTASEESDIDIAVIASEFENMNLWDKAKYLGRASREIEYSLDVLGYSPSEVRKARAGTLLWEILHNGTEVQ